MIATYVIIGKDDLPSVTGWGGVTVLPQSPDGLRWNHDPEGTKTIINFRASDPTPSFLEGKTQYTHAEILEIVNTEEWTPPDIFPE